MISKEVDLKTAYNTLQRSACFVPTGQSDLNGYSTNIFIATGLSL
ncbi:hypothetical protein [Fulvivirga kasyanovii]|nr:hypothetical protein [Fulvivirga kasyanovii]